MNTIKPCKRGNIAPRSKSGHCTCIDCKSYTYNVAKNRVGKKEYQKKWSSENRDKCSGYVKKWNSLHKQQRRAIEVSYEKRNPEKKREKNRRAHKNWYKKNKNKLASYIKARNRQISKRKRTPSWADLEEINKFYTEAYRLTQLTGIPHEVDHIVPLQGEFISGLHVHQNLQILTRLENRRKKNTFVWPES